MEMEAGRTAEQRYREKNIPKNNFTKIFDVSKLA
jgi:hypothetical protein